MSQQQQQQVTEDENWEFDDRDVTIITMDSKKIKTKWGYVVLSGMLQDMLEDNEDGDEIELPIPNVNSVVFEKIHEYMKQYHKQDRKEIPKPLKGNFKDHVSKWDEEFLSTMDVS